MREAACSALKRLFAADAQGDVTLEAVKLIAKAVKEDKYRAPADAVRTFLALHLEEAEESLEKKALTKSAERKKKRDIRLNEKRDIEVQANQSQEDVEASLREADSRYPWCSRFACACVCFLADPFTRVLCYYLTHLLVILGLSLVYCLISGC